MFVRTAEELRDTPRHKVLRDGDTQSLRYLTAEDGMGFSLHANRVRPCEPHLLWYKHHWEANYIVEGRVRVTDLSSDESWTLGPGDLYQVGPNDRHHFEVLEQDYHVSVFCPPLTGHEVHDEDGAYSASGPIPATERRMFVVRVDALRAAGHERIVADGQARSVRALTRGDGLGFSFSDVRLRAGAAARLWYKHHREANYVLAGTGAVEDAASDHTWPLGPGVLYCVGPEDRHVLRAETDLHLVSVFCPPIEGDEQHDADGAFPPTGPLPPGPAA